MKKSLTIIKAGGAVVEDNARLNSLIDAFCNIDGYKMLVTGGGRTATSIAARLGIESHMIEGRRITDSAMLEVVTMVYAGLVSKNVVAELQAKGVNSIGLCGADMNIIRCIKRPVGRIDYGYVGDIDTVNVKELKMLINTGVVPVFCPITHNGMGQLLNTNADTIASALAASFASEYDVTLIYCFEKNGVLADPEDENSVIPEISSENYMDLREREVISGGMIPKIDNAFAAIDAGVNKVLITNAENLGKDNGTEIV